MKLSLVHDWFRVNAGSEKVVSEILDIYEDEDVKVFSLFNYLSQPERKDILKNRAVNVSPLHYIPFAKRIYRYMLPLMPYFIQRFFICESDVVISSSHAVAKGFRKSAHIPHICYCHTPMRYAWDLYEDYSKDSSRIKAFFHKAFLRYIRKWDYESSRNVNYFVANSVYVQQRIKRIYRRQAEVIYPPVRVDKFRLSEKPREDFYLCVGRCVPYKKIDVIIHAFRNMPDKKLVLIGDGYGSDKIRKLLADAPNIEWLGYKNDDEMISYMQKAKACIFAAKEDFGIMCVESQACGTPVLALNNGGYKETVIDGLTGYFFNEQSEEEVRNAVRKFDAIPLTDHNAIRDNAVRFSSDRFKKELVSYVDKCLNHFHGKTKEPSKVLAGNAR